MNIEELFKEQLQLQQLWHDWSTLSESERNSLARELLLNLHEGTTELHQMVDQSRYHVLKQQSQLDPYMLADAGVKVARLLVALLLLRGVTPMEFMRAWEAVDKRVKGKWKWQQDELSVTEVLMCDLDGVVAMYAEGFNAWCRDRHGLALKGHINAPDLEPIKDEFHSTGGFVGLEPVPGAVEVLNRWRQKSANRRLVMVTARPYKRYKQVYSDTIVWLRHYNVGYDHILFERDKSEAVRQCQPANIIGHIEDRGKHALEVASTGVRVYKLPYATPEEQISHPLITLVKGWGEISNHLGVPL